MSVAGKLVVIAGATSASGLAAARALSDAGARIVAVGRREEALRELTVTLRGPAVTLRGPAVTLREPAVTLRGPAVTLREVAGPPPAGSCDPLARPQDDRIGVTLRGPAVTLREPAVTLRGPAVTLREVAGPPPAGSSDPLAQPQDDSAARGTLRTEACDLTDEAAVLALAQRIHDADGPVDGVFHLVGGWRGGGGLAGQSDADFRFLEQSLTALRHVSRAFYTDLSASSAGRLAVVSSTAVARPLAGGANYASVKAATEAWARAVAQGFVKDARDAGRELNAASVIFRVKSLESLEEDLARRFVGLWTTPASEINDTIVELTEIGRP